MKSKVFGLYLLLPASLAMIAGCAQSDGAKDAQASAAAPEGEQTGEAKAPLRSGSWSAGVPIPGAIGYGTPSLATFRGRMHMLHRGLSRRFPPGVERAAAEATSSAMASLRACRRCADTTK